MATFMDGCMRAFSRTVFSFVLVMSANMNHALAQAIPNAGFETWVGGYPVSWGVSSIPPIFTITQSNEPHSGISAADGQVIPYQGGFLRPTLSASFPINTRPQALHGWYKFTSIGDNQFYVRTEFYLLGAYIGDGYFSTRTSTVTYREFTVSIDWYTTLTPDSVTITIFVPGGGHLGTRFVVDDLTFRLPSDVHENGWSIPQEFSVEQNYPNPFNPTTKINFSVPTTSFTTLKVFDILGKEVATLVNEELKPGSYETTFSAKGGSASGGDGKDLSSGVYFYRLQAGSFVETKKLLLLR